MLPVPDQLLSCWLLVIAAVANQALALPDMLLASFLFCCRHAQPGSQSVLDCNQALAHTVTVLQELVIRYYAANPPADVENSSDDWGLTSQDIAHSSLLANMNNAHELRHLSVGAR